MNLDGYFLGCYGANYSADFSVVKPNRLTGLYAVKEFRQRHADARRLRRFAIGRGSAGGTGFQTVRQNKRVAGIEKEGLLLRWNWSDSCAPAGLVFPLIDRLHEQVGGEVRCFGALCPAIFTNSFDNRYGPARPARVGKPNAIAGREGRKPPARHGNRNIFGLWRHFRLSLRGQPNARGRLHPTEVIPLGASPDDGGARLNRSGTQFRTGQIHFHLAAFPRFLLRPSKISNHAPPSRFVVMSAVDSHAIHASMQQVLDEGIVGRGSRRHCDHDADIAAWRFVSEQDFGIALQQSTAFGRVANRSGEGRRSRLLLLQPGEGSHHGLHAAQNVGLYPAQ